MRSLALADGAGTVDGHVTEPEAEAVGYAVKVMPQLGM